MKVLFVAFEFPPTTGGGIQRPLKFAKYLPDHGITPIVVTPEFSVAQEAGDLPPDTNQLKEVPEDLIVERVPYRSIHPYSSNRFIRWSRKFLSVGESQGASWKPFLDQHLPEIVRKYRPEALYVTIPPFSMASLWAEYAARYKLPSVVDFRDGWSQWQVGPYATYAHYRRTLSLEGQCLARARRVVCSSDQIRGDLLRHHPNQDESKFVTITNGYDAEIDGWDLRLRERHENERFTIGYVGAFYYTPETREAMMSPWWRKPPHRMLQYASRREDWLYRSPFFFFRAVAELLRSRPALRKQLGLRFAGKKPPWFDEQVRTFGLTDIVEHVGFLAHADALRFQTEADCLLVTSSKVIGGDDYSIAGKTFEYFSAKKPILAFVCPGAQKDILERSGMAVICDPDATGASAIQIGELMDGAQTLCPDSDFLNSLHRRRLTGQLAQVLLSLR
jgi:glycosyltransferase involved in cell wall biosynthesis